MSKSETVLELQELLKDMRSITVDLNRSISSLKEILDVEEFIPTSLGEKIRTYLEKINEKQTEFVSKYEALNSREPNTKYVVLENELEEAKKVFEENDRYVNGIKFFLSLHSDDEKTENILQNRKNTLNNLNIDAMERDDLQSLGKPYIWLQEAFWEIDAKKKFSLMYRLASCFEEEIAMGIQFGTLSIKEPNDEVLNVEITNNSSEKGAVELDTSESPVDETEKDENNYVVKNESKESEMEEPELVDNVAGKEYEGILVKEKPFILHVQMSSKAETKFGVKEFRNDIIKQYPKEKLECMVEALKGCGYSIKSITEKKNGKAESYKLSTEKLYQFGYLKRYVVDKMGEFFTLSPRGERAFVAKDSLSFINQNIKEKVSSQDDGEPIEDTANSSIVRLLSFDSSIKQRKLVPDYEFVIRMNVMATDYFVEGYPGKDSDITNWFAGIVTENVEQLQEFKETVNDKVNPGDVLIVTGNTLEQAETVANWLLSEFTLELRNIGYTTYLRPYLAEVVSSVCGDDVELCAACVLRGMEFLSLPDQTINDIIESCHRSDGERYFFNKSKEEITVSIWESQLKYIFPLIESYRKYFVKRYIRAIKNILPISNSYGEKVTIPEDVEIGTLFYLVGRGDIVISSTEYNELERYRNARNRLAHMNVLENEEVEAILKAGKHNISLS